MASFAWGAQKLDAHNIMSRITMDVTIHPHREWKWRLSLGVWLIRLAAWIMWMPVKVEVKETQNDKTVVDSGTLPQRKRI